MVTRNITVWMLVALLPQLVAAQSVLNLDTIPSGHNLQHTYLNIEIPVGEVFIKSSGICGASISKLSAPDSFVQHHIQARDDLNGNHFRNISLKYPQLSPKNSVTVAGQAANLRLAEPAPTIETFAEQGNFRSEYAPDPSMSTDLFLDLGYGSSRLDLSGLTLQNLSINSAFTDVFVTYSEPNLVPMKKMDIHAAKADIVLKNLEQARAELITIQNDMGATKLILGDSRMAKSTIYIQSGVGSCMLVVDEQQPIKLMLKAGFFSNVEIPDGFKKIEKGIYANKAYQKNPKECTRIICNIDFGTISIIEKN